MLGPAGKPVPMEVEIWGRYVDMAERRGGQWRTAQRIVTFELTFANGSTGLPLGASWAEQGRDTSDPLYTMRRRAIDHGKSRV
jgi:hypothetical protein